MAEHCSKILPYLHRKVFKACLVVFNIIHEKGLAPVSTSPLKKGFKDLVTAFGSGLYGIMSKI